MLILLGRLVDLSFQTLIANNSGRGERWRNSDCRIGAVGTFRNWLLDVSEEQLL
jgi:hypothetical protein